MYWCKSKLKIAFSIGAAMLMLCVEACGPGTPGKGETLTYFDLKGYFKADSLRLAKKNPMVYKTVAHNGHTESKTVHIKNWGVELSLFTGSDINRPAWKNSYDVSDDGGVIMYNAKSPEMKMRRMIIKKEKGAVKWILIYNKTKNLLYTTTEKLTYYADSLYLIQKDQKVRLMGKNSYVIKGVILK
jgi:hypothetical protein